MSHTPGPWEARKVYDNWPIVSSKKDKHGAKLYVAHIITHEDSHKELSVQEAIANAKLIAAAPEMKAMLERVMQHMKMYQEVEYHFLIKEVEAVLEKAGY